MIACSLGISLLRSRQVMTNFHLTPPTILPSLAVREAREKRRRVLEKAAQVRRANYHHFIEKKRQLQADNKTTILTEL